MCGHCMLGPDADFGHTRPITVTFGQYWTPGHILAEALVVRDLLAP